MPARKSHIAELFACLLLVALSVPANLAAAYKASEFQANYALYVGGLHVANSTLRVEKSGDFWRWRLATKPQGIYSLFTKSSPYSETTLSLLDGKFRIHNILDADEANDKKYENARFNWNSNKIEVQRNGKRSLINLTGKVYDYHSVNLLSAEMLESGLEEASITFYYKGALVESVFRVTGKSELEIEGKVVDLTIFEQTSSASKSITRYFYDIRRPGLPIKIENKKQGKKTSILLLQSFHQN